jgi:hypothetical protein
MKIHVTTASIANFKNHYHWSVDPYVTAVTGDAFAANAAEHLDPALIAAELCLTEDEKQAA